MLQIIRHCNFVLVKVPSIGDSFYAVGITEQVCTAAIGLILLIIYHNDLPEHLAAGSTPYADEGKFSTPAVTPMMFSKVSLTSAPFS